MRVHNVHARDLAVPPERVGALLEGLGGDEDRLWPPAERWPTSRLELDRPLAVGASGGHDPRVRYAVETYEPGRRVVFRFAPGVGLVGTHGFEVEGLGAGRSRLTHTLACRVEPKLLALWPIVRRQHDALIEDIFDQAELATTGRIARRARWPLAVRVANRVELAFARSQGRLPARDDVPPARSATDRLARVSAVAVPSALIGLATLHAAWALGWRWPGGDERAWAERVGGYGATQAPPDASTWAVTLALAGAAAIVATAAAGTPSRTLRLATWGVAGVFLARGAISIPVALVRGFDEIFARLDFAIYSPLCLALGVGTAAVARRARLGHQRSPRSAAALR